MDNTDVLFGRDNDDLLIGKLGGDTLLAGADDDILIGGPEKGQAPNSDVLVGDTGDDINIWAPGDGSDAFIGNEDKDTMIFAPFVENTDGSLLITRTLRTQDPAREDRRPAGVHLHGRATCRRRNGSAAQFLVRFNVNGNPVVTVRQKDVEKVFCPSPEAGKAVAGAADRRRPHHLPHRVAGPDPRHRRCDPRAGIVTEVRS